MTKVAKRSQDEKERPSLRLVKGGLSKGLSKKCSGRTDKAVYGGARDRGGGDGGTVGRSLWQEEKTLGGSSHHLKRLHELKELGDWKQKGATKSSGWGGNRRKWDRP